MVRWFLFLISIGGFAQQKVVEATYLYSDDFTNREELLIADSQQAFYVIFKNLSTNKQDIKLERKDDVMNVYDPNRVTSSNLLFKYANETINYTYLKTKIGELIVEDNMPKLKWVITDEQRKIGDLNCQKMNTNFRGRSYEGWYTEDVSIPFGPYKFSGLPGLIIEIYSIDGSNISWRLNKLVRNQKMTIPKIEDFNGVRYTLKEIVEEQERQRDMESSRVLSRLNKGVRETGTKIERLGAERTYEWELEESDKN